MFITAHKASLHKTTVPASVHAWLGAAAALLVAVQALVGPAKAASPVERALAADPARALAACRSRRRSHEAAALWLLLFFSAAAACAVSGGFRCKVCCGRSVAALASRL